MSPTFKHDDDRGGPGDAQSATSPMIVWSFSSARRWSAAVDFTVTGFECSLKQREI